MTTGISATICRFVVPSAQKKPQAGTPAAMDALRPDVRDLKRSYAPAAK
ncbi:hypothetical protein [Paenibacillus ehimensis]|nr:hypothetical protein [Paenibacillus ehimensis]